MVQASELGLHAIGIDVSSFNAFISNTKIGRPDTNLIQQEAGRITQELTKFYRQSRIGEFDAKLTNELYQFNKQYFPVPEYKYKLNQGQINERDYIPPLEKEFVDKYYQLVSQYQIELNQNKYPTTLRSGYLLRTVSPSASLLDSSSATLRSRFSLSCNKFFLFVYIILHFSGSAM